MKRKYGWQVWSYEWADQNGPIPLRALFGGHVFATLKLAKEAWYDSDTGRNDRATYCKVMMGWRS